MNDYSGYWLGEIRGTNNANFTMEIEQQDELVSGTATFNDSMFGAYSFSVNGSANSELRISLVPRNAPPALRLGIVHANATLQKDGTLKGHWKSEISTNGVFVARRSEVALPEVAQRVQPRAGSRRNLKRGLEIDAYLLDVRLGRGHSAEVWKATVLRDIEGTDLRTGDEVAIKFYFPSMLYGTDTLRIQREFNIAVDLDHPNLAKVHDLMLAPSRPHHTFMVMQYVPGNTLKSRLEQDGALDIASTYKVARQLFEALEQLHSLGAIHRDVKAANIIVTEDKEVAIKLVDLGIVAVEHDGGFTNASAFLGSKHSASMEQLTGQPIDVRTDIYGAGSVIFHCLKGVPMYDAVGPEAAIALRMQASPERLEGSDAFTQFINRCISVQAKDRPRSARECLETLSVIAIGSPGSSNPAMMHADAEDLDELLAALSDQIMPRSGKWTANAIMKANSVLNARLLGRRVKVRMLAEAVERTAEGRYAGVRRIHARNSDSWSLKGLPASIWAYFGGHDPKSAARHDSIKSGSWVTVVGTIMRADIDGQLDASLHLDLNECEFIDERGALASGTG